MLGRDGKRDAGGAEIYMECDPGPQAGSVEERVCALEGGDVFGETGRHADHEGGAGILLDVAMGAGEVFVVDGASGAGGAEEAIEEQGIESREKGIDKLR